jgi:hypothetical protein
VTGRRTERRWIGWLTALLLASCGAPATGPVEVHWDRDSCEWCSMAISDRRYAAQVRVEPGGAAHRFDDPGCALLWIDQQLGEGRRPAELWVRDRSGQRWLGGLEAGWMAGEHTPMNYGFGATDPGAGEDLVLDEVWEAVRIREGERRGR